MSISIKYRIVRPETGTSLPGIDHDWATFQEVFGQKNLTVRDADLLRAMSLAQGGVDSLWAALHCAVSDLDDDQEIEVSVEW